MTPVAVKATLYDSQDREVRVEATYTPGTPDRGPDMECAGGYPGDPECIEDVRVVAVDEGADVAEVQAREDEIDEAVRAAAADAYARYEP